MLLPVSLSVSELHPLAESGVDEREQMTKSNHHGKKIPVIVCIHTTVSTLITNEQKTILEEKKKLAMKTHTQRNTFLPY